MNIVLSYRLAAVAQAISRRHASFFFGSKKALVLCFAFGFGLNVEKSWSASWPTPIPITTTARLELAVANLNATINNCALGACGGLAAAQAEYRAALAAASSSAVLQVTTNDSISSRLNIPAGNAASIQASNNATLTIDGISGSFSGGAIFLSASSVLDISASNGGLIVFSNNKTTSNFGGAIYNSSGILSITDSQFTGNEVIISSFAGYGGAIYNSGGMLSITDSQFTGNGISIPNSGNGGAIFNGSGMLSIIDSQFTENKVNTSGSNLGGAILNVSGTVSITDSQFTGNEVNSPGFARGGAIYNDSGTLSITNSQFKENKATSTSSDVTGGAIYNNSGTLNIIDSQFIGNEAIPGNTGYGGAVFTENGALNLTTTISRTSIFTGNLANNQASSIHFANSSPMIFTITTENDALLDMRDPMSKTGTGAVTLNKEGVGTWKLGGANQFSTASMAFAMNAGTLYLYGAGEVTNANSNDPSALVEAGAVTLSDAASSFTLGDGTVLASGGINSITTGGTITLAGGSTLRGDSTTSALTLSPASSISLTGEVTVHAEGSNQLALTGVLDGADGSLVKTGSGLVVLNSANTYAGGSTVEAGILRAGIAGAFVGNSAYTINGGSLDLNNFSLTMTSLQGTGGNVLLGSAALTVNQSANTSFSGKISGTGGLTKSGAGKLTLAGANTYSGETQLTAGSLHVTGSISDSDVTVGSGTTLSGGNSATLGKLVTISSGGTLLGESGSELSMTSLVLDNNSILSVTLGSPSGNALFSVAQDVTLGGSLSVTEDTGYGAGVYRLINYNGVLTNNGLSTSNPDLFIQTAIPKQINIVNTAGVSLRFWDGDNPADFNNGVINGGNGIWNLTNGSWTNADGTINAPYAPEGGFAVFMGSPGVVTVDNTDGQVSATGIQFAVGGYELTGDVLSLTGAGTIRVGDGTIVGQGMIATINSVLEGSVGLMKTDLGTLVLGATNTYTGGTQINAGVVEISADDNLGDSSGGMILNTGTLRTTAAVTTGRNIIIGSGGGTFDTQADLTLNGSITGSGSLTKKGSGILILVNNSSTGQTTIDSGTLRAGSATALRQNDAYVINGGTLDLNGYPLTMSLLSGTGGTVNLSGTTLSLNQSATSTYSGSLAGDGASIFALNGAGYVILDGNSSAYLGQTQINMGALAVNGQLGGDLLVSLQGRLQGIGTVGNTTVYGTIAPGNSIGTLKVNGNYVQQAGSVYEVEIDTLGNSDLINITGTATLNGGEVQVHEASGSYSVNSRYTILSALGGVNGQFASITNDLPLLSFGLNYDNNNVYLVISRSSITFADLAQTANQRAVAISAESLGSGNPVYDAIVNLSTANQAQEAFNSLSGESYVSGLSALLEESRYLRDAVSKRLEQASECLHGRQSAECTWWVDGFGSWGKLNSNGNAASLNRDTRGLFLGADRTFGEYMRVGVTGGYSRSDWNVAARSAQTNTDTYSLGIYGKAPWHKLDVRAGAGYSWHVLNTIRQVRFPGFANTVYSTPRAHTAQAFGEVVYDLYHARIALEPYAGLAYVQADNEAWREQGGPAALRGKGNDEAWYTTVGLREATALYQGERMTLDERLLLGWRHAYTGVTPSAVMAFASGSAPMLIGGVPIARDALLIDASLQWRNCDKNLNFRLGYMGQWSSQVQDHGVSGIFSWRFA